MRSLLFTEPVDFLIGNTYGKFLERDTGTPLIRIGFPIFDRHHHHRYPVWGYQGGLNVLVWILDKIFDEIDKQHERRRRRPTTASTSSAETKCKSLADACSSHLHGVHSFRGLFPGKERRMNSLALKSRMCSTSRVAART